MIILCTYLDTIFDEPIIKPNLQPPHSNHQFSSSLHYCTIGSIHPPRVMARECYLSTCNGMFVFVIASGCFFPLLIDSCYFWWRHKVKLPTATLWPLFLFYSLLPENRNNYSLNIEGRGVLSVDLQQHVHHLCHLQYFDQFIVDLFFFGLCLHISFKLQLFYYGPSNHLIVTINLQFFIIWPMGGEEGWGYGGKGFFISFIAPLHPPLLSLT